MRGHSRKCLPLAAADYLPMKRSSPAHRLQDCFISEAGLGILCPKRVPLQKARTPSP